MPNFAPLYGLAGMLVCGAVVWLLRDRSRVVRVLAGGVAAFVVAGAVGLLGGYLDRSAARNDPAVFAARVEREILGKFPGMVEALKEQDPAGLRDLEAQMFAIYT